LVHQVLSAPEEHEHLAIETDSIASATSEIQSAMHSAIEHVNGQSE
jgi:hypothetical protein